MPGGNRWRLQSSDGVSASSVTFLGAPDSPGFVPTRAVPLRCLWESSHLSVLYAYLLRAVLRLSCSCQAERAQAPMASVSTTVPEDPWCTRGRGGRWRVDTLQSHT